MHLSKDGRCYQRVSSFSRLQKPSMYAAMLVSGMLPLESVNAADFSAMLGAAVVSSESYVRGEDGETKLYPYGQFSYGAFTASIEGVGFVFEISESDSLGVLLTTRDSAFDSSNPVLTSLDTPNDAIDLNLTWSRSEGGMEYGLAVATDVSDNHNGWEVSASIAKPMILLGGRLSPSLELAYQNDDIIDYFYGVTPEESSPNLSSYKGEGTFITSLGAQYFYKLSDNWVTLAMVKYTHLGSGIADSPIVEKESVWSGVLGLGYQF